MLQGMAFTPVTLWANETHRCVLRRTDGRLEVLLYHDTPAVNT